MAMSKPWRRPSQKARARLERKRYQGRRIAETANKLHG
jgi:hypothetical protein